MKKAMAKHSLQLLAAMLVMLGAMTFSATEVRAQGSDLQLLAQSPTYNWVSEAEALNALETQLELLQTNLNSQTPGTPAYNDVVNHMTYYKLIFTSIEEGMATMEATNSNLFEVPNHNGSVDKSPIPVNFQQLYIDAIGFLTN